MDTKGFDEENRKLRVELGRAKGDATGWAKKADKRLGHIAECESALAKRNERIAELEKQVADLRAELADAEVPSGRERAILDMWPRFEDGEPVWYGDEVDNMRSSVIAVEFFDGSITMSSDFDHLHLGFGERVKRPAPKVLDADGVEIKVGDTVYAPRMYGDNSFTVSRLTKNRDGRTLVMVEEMGSGLFPETVTHTRPDSWKQLEEDAAREPCDYFGVECDEDKGCSGCPHLHKGRDCTIDMQADLIRRAKALAGVEVDA